MTRTGALPEESAVPDLAVGYTTYDIERGEFTLVNEHRNTGTLPYWAAPAGTGYTTVEDLWRFATALTGHRLLDAQHTALVTTGRGTIGWDARHICYGFFEEFVSRIRLFGHIGGAHGMSGDFVVWPGTGHIIAVLANIDPPIATEVSRFISARLPLISV